MNRQKDTSWNNSSSWYHKKVGAGGHHFHTKVILPVIQKLMKLNQKSRVYDFGCGQGVLSRTLPQNCDYLGIDLAPKLVEEAKKLNQNPNHKFLVADVTKPLKIKDKATDIFVILALQNMRNCEGVFKNVDELLVTGGNLIMVINHPMFRIPRQSGWSITENKQQARWVSKYMSSMEIPITMHPGDKRSETTWSYHHPLSSYIKMMNQHNLVLVDMEELVSDKESEGKAAKMENRSRAEIPMFMVLVAKKAFHS